MLRRPEIRVLKRHGCEVSARHRGFEAQLGWQVSNQIVHHKNSRKEKGRIPATLSKLHRSYPITDIV